MLFYLYTLLRAGGYVVSTSIAQKLPMLFLWSCRTLRCCGEQRPRLHNTVYDVCDVCVFYVWALTSAVADGTRKKRSTRAGLDWLSTRLHPSLIGLHSQFSISHTDSLCSCNSFTIHNIFHRPNRWKSYGYIDINILRLFFTLPSDLRLHHYPLVYIFSHPRLYIFFRFLYCMLRLHAPVFSRKHFDGADDIVYQSAGHKLSLPYISAVCIFYLILRY